MGTAGPSSRSPSDSHQITEHSLTGELEPGTRPDDHHLTQGLGATDHGVVGPIDPSEPIVGRQRDGLHARDGTLDGRDLATLPAR
jgi:hypothetical protein